MLFFWSFVTIQAMSTPDVFGRVMHGAPSLRPADYLYRISLKCLVRNACGDVLVVKERGRNHWDLPGGGMDHGESLKSTIARELQEEVGYDGDFSYAIVHAEEPKLLDEHKFWQLRLVYVVTPQHYNFETGEDGDEIAFVDPLQFKDSEANVERRVYEYSCLAAKH